MPGARCRPCRAGFKSCPREGASLAWYHTYIPAACFKSCPREGASPDDGIIGKNEYVSSRAPVRGHPLPVHSSTDTALVSSRAPVRGHPHRSA